MNDKFFGNKVLFPSLEEDILMQQTEGFEMEGKKNYVCRLKRFIYGLKQSPRKWYQRFDEFIITHGYNRSAYDSCIYYSKVGDGFRI